jgi:PiT family inorganic phosphate transporter
MPVIGSRSSWNASSSRTSSEAAIDPVLVSVIAIIAVALVFDFLNGFHDAANSVATVVSTGTLTPNVAVAWAAFFNFVAAFGFGVKVATTLGKGVVDPSAVDRWVVLGGLVGAIFWDVITWWLGLPVSSSHALIGGLAGAAVAHAGFGVLVFGGLFKIALFIVLSPLLGLVLGYLMMNLLLLLNARSMPSSVDRRFRRLQLVSAAFYSLGHGTNDAQKTMGIISVLLFTSGFMPVFHVPIWVILSCHAAIAAGTLMGGWRIVKTMGMKITKLKPIGGFSAETAGAMMLIGTALWGIPVSTTHTITGAIMGVGATHRLSAVRWGVATRIVWAWILTIPLSALVAALAYAVISLMV